MWFVCRNLVSVFGTMFNKVQSLSENFKVKGEDILSPPELYSW